MPTAISLMENIKMQKYGFSYPLYLVFLWHAGVLVDEHFSLSLN